MMKIIEDSNERYQKKVIYRVLSKRTLTCPLKYKSKLLNKKQKMTLKNTLRIIDHEIKDGFVGTARNIKANGKIYFSIFQVMEHI